MAAITLGSGALAQGGGGGGGGAGGGASGAGGAAGGAAQVALLGRVAHTALLEEAARPEQVTRTALLVFSPPAAQAKTLSTPRVRALARGQIRPPEQIIQSCVPIGTPCRRLPIGRLGLPSAPHGYALGTLVASAEALPATIR